jgi:hypothetical protein
MTQEHVFTFTSDLSIKALLIQLLPTLKSKIQPDNKL